jgi:hypothetical protein
MGFFRPETARWPEEMLKMKEPPGMYVKTKARMTKHPIIERTPCPKIHKFCNNERQLMGFSGPEMAR